MSKVRYPSSKSFETAFLQALLMISERLGIISQTISPMDNKKGKMTKAAILQMKKAVDMEADETLSLTFARKLYQEILDNLPVVGDVNGDGKVDAEDAQLILDYEAQCISSLPVMDAADVSGDGIVDSNDAVLILQFENGRFDKFPVEE